MSTGIILPDLVGDGFRLPFEFDSDGGGVRDTVDDDLLRKIRQMIYLALFTRKGSLFMHTLGTAIPDLVFDPNDPTLEAELKYEVQQAFKLWLPQLVLFEVYVYEDESDPNQVGLAGSFGIRNTPVRENFVFPHREGAFNLDA